MDTPRKVIVGYDLCDDFTRISCYSYKLNEPIPIGLEEGESEDSQIPTVLCIKNDTKQWLFGEEAIRGAQNGQGLKAEHLLTKLRNDEVTELYEVKFTAISLMEKFLRKTLTLVKNYFPTEQISKLVITIRDTEPILVDRIYEALALLGIGKDRAVVISHAGAYLYYALSQDKSLWMNDVGLFDFNREGLHYYQIRLSRRTRPVIAILHKADYTNTLNIDMLKQKDISPSYIFENIAGEVLYKQIITTLYFTGSGFEGDWAEEVIRGLCTGRRVFYGQNLFTKGACYAARELSGDKRLTEILLLNDDMVRGSVELRVYRDTKFIEVPLVQAGDIWYEVDQSIDVIPEGQAELEIIRKDIMTKDVFREKLALGGFPERPDRTSRLNIHFSCTDKTTGILRVTDLGFGDFFPASGEIMEFTLEI